MDDGVIFGPSVNLPSLPGLQSGCEEEILLLLKEVDLEYQKRHSGLLNELEIYRSIYQDHKAENKSMNNEVLHKELVKIYFNEIEKLKKNNNELRNENISLRKEVQRLSDLQHYSEKKLSLYQGEIKTLNERLMNVMDECQSYQNSYKTLMNILTADVQIGKDNSNNKVDDSSPSNLLDSVIVATTEKVLTEETESMNKFEFKINQVIDNFKKSLREIV